MYHMSTDLLSNRPEKRADILIIESDDVILENLERILGESSNVHAADTAAEGLVRVREVQPDLVLLGVSAADSSGFEILERLKSDVATRDVPVMLISGNNDVDEEERGLTLGAADYITTPFHDAIVRARVRTHILISTQIRAIEELCMMDPLTKIPNRRGFDERFRVEWARGVRESQPLSMLMMDLDKFKTYNDTYGHPQGDELLKAVAKTFTDVLMRSTDFVARIGGEEFVVLLPNTDEEGVLIVAERLRSAVEATWVPLLRDPDSMTCATISIGAATVVPHRDFKPESLTMLADAALYRAKGNGRNRVCS